MCLIHVILLLWVILVNKVANKTQKHRKNAVRIQNAILNSVDTFPKSINEIALDINSDKRTVLKYVLQLNDLGVIKKADFNSRQLWIRR